MKVQRLGAIVLGAMLAGGTSLYALDITINDNTDSSTFGTDTRLGINEDQEVEKNCTRSQSWDLEAFNLNGRSLEMVGGFNFLQGQPDSRGTGGDYPNRFEVGDIFLALGDKPLFGRDIGTDIQVGNGVKTISNAFGYDYVLDIDWKHASGGSVSYEVIPIDGASLVSGYFEQNECSNPWRYGSGGGASVFNGVGTYTYYDHDIDGLQGGEHYAATFDLDFLAGQQIPDLWVHTTLECGNDNLLGHVENYDLRYHNQNQNQVPDGGVTAMLLGLGLAGLAALRRSIC